MPMITLFESDAERTYILEVTEEEAAKVNEDSEFATQLLYDRVKSAQKRTQLSVESETSVPPNDDRASDSDITEEKTQEISDPSQEKNSFRWPQEAILLLLRFYKEHEHKITSGKMSLTKLWNIVACQLIKNGYNVNGSQCKSKMAGLRNTYKNVKDYNEKNYVKRTWKYFEIMDKLFKEKPCTVPVPAVESNNSILSPSEDASNSKADTPSLFKITFPCKRKNYSILAKVLEENATKRKKMEKEAMARQREILDTLQKLLNKNFLEMSYLYDDEDESIVLNNVFAVNDHGDIPNFQDHIEHIPMLSSENFKSQFRMLPSTFEFILNQIGDKLTRIADGNEMIPAEKQLLLSLWRFATPDSYTSIVERFNVGKGTALRSVRRVANSLCDLSSKYVVWPTKDKIPEIVLGFSEISGILDTIGVIGGIHINIPTLKGCPETFKNRKNRYSIHLQAVCDHTQQFTLIYVGNVKNESLTEKHEADIQAFNLSSFYEYINNSDKFPNNTHLIGDSVYRLRRHLLVPYLDKGYLTKYQNNYNYCHLYAEMTIRKSFALLKGRWKSLLHVLAVNQIDFAPFHILACCVLHNICLQKQDELQLQEDIIIELDVLDREDLGIQEIKDYRDQNIAVTKRNNICKNLRKMQAK